MCEYSNPLDVYDFNTIKTGMDGCDAHKCVCIQQSVAVNSGIYTAVSKM